MGGLALFWLRPRGLVVLLHQPGPGDRVTSHTAGMAACPSTSSPTAAQPAHRGSQPWRRRDKAVSLPWLVLTTLFLLA